jgi:hypothetical protein
MSGAPGPWQQLLQEHAAGDQSADALLATANEVVGEDAAFSDADRLRAAVYGADRHIVVLGDADAGRRALLRCFGATSTYHTTASSSSSTSASASSSSAAASTAAAYGMGYAYLLVDVPTAAAAAAAVAASTASGDDAAAATTTKAATSTTSSASSASICVHVWTIGRVEHVPLLEAVLAPTPPSSPSSSSSSPSLSLADVVFVVAFDVAAGSPAAVHARLRAWLSALATTQTTLLAAAGDAAAAAARAAVRRHLQC